MMIEKSVSVTGTARRIGRTGVSFDEKEEDEESVENYRKYYAVHMEDAAHNISGVCIHLDGWRLREPLNNSSAVEQRVFCPIHAVLKMGNTQSIPAFPELSTGPKSLAVSS